MNTTFKLRTLTIIVLCLYIFWAGIGIDLVLYPSVERYPLHRGFILLTFFVLIFNLKQVFSVFLQNKALIVLIFYVLLTAAWADNASVVVKDFIFLFSALIISILTALAFADHQIGLIRWLFWLFLLMTLASIIVGIYYPHIGINIKDFGKPRWVGITNHPNALGAEGLTLTWLAANLLFLSKKYLEKAITLFALLAAVYIIRKADSITSLLDAFVVIACVCYYYIFNRLSLPIKLIFFMLVSLSFLFVVSFYMGAEEMSSSILKSTGRSASFSGRTELWGKALIAASDNPIFGYGFDDLLSLTKKYHILMVHLHNGYIETLVKGGVIGLILLVYILVKTLIDQFRINLKYKKDFIFLNSGFIMILIHNITESSVLKGLNALNILLILIIISTSLLSSANKTKG